MMPPNIKDISVEGMEGLMKSSNRIFIAPVSEIPD